MKINRIVPLPVILFLTGCLFDSGNQVAGGGEDFPNTIAPLGLVAASDISSNTQWDQFQTIPQTPNVLSLADSLSLPITASALTKFAAQFGAQFNVDSNPANSTRVYTVSENNQKGLLQSSFQISPGLDGNFDTPNDNGVIEYDALQLDAGGDTLEWTRITDGDGDEDAILSGNSDTGVVVMNYLSLSPPLLPQVERRTVSLKAGLYHRGDSTVLLSYQEQDVLRNGTVTNYAIKGVRRDSLLIPGDTALVTFDQTQSADAPLSQSNGRYFVHLAARPGCFKDNALLNFTVETYWRSGVLRHSILNFTPAVPLVSGNSSPVGTFTDSTEDQLGVLGNVNGTFYGDTLQADMTEVRNGKSSTYHMVYDANGEVKEQQVQL